MVIVVGAVHTVLLWTGHLLVARHGRQATGKDRRGLCWQSKDAHGRPLGLASVYYGGLTVLPMVAYHVSQLLIDTLVADRLRVRGEGDRGPPVP